MRSKTEKVQCGNPEELQTIVNKYLAGYTDTAIRMMKAHLERCYACWQKMQRVVSIVDLFSDRGEKNVYALFLRHMSTMMVENNAAQQTQGRMTIHQLHLLVSSQSASSPMDAYSESVKEELIMATDLYTSLEAKPHTEAKREYKQTRMWLTAAAVAAMFFLTLQNVNREVQKSLLPALADASSNQAESSNYFTVMPRERAGVDLNPSTRQVSFSLPVDQVLTNFYRVDIPPRETATLFFNVNMGQ